MEETSSVDLVLPTTNQSPMKTLILPSLSVVMNHRLVSASTWIHCQHQCQPPGGCSAIFQSLKSLLQHEQTVHGAELQLQPCDTDTALSFGTYQLIRLRPGTPFVRVNRLEVEDCLRQQAASTESPTSLRQLRAPRRTAPEFSGSQNDDDDEYVETDQRQRRRGRRRRPGPRRYRKRISTASSASKPFACTFKGTERPCSVRLSSAYALQNHLKLHQRKLFYCDKCPLRYKSEESLQAHFARCLMRVFEPRVEEPSTVGAMMEALIANPMDEGAGGEPEEDPLSTTKVTAPFSKLEVLIDEDNEIETEDDHHPAPSFPLKGVDMKILAEEISDVDTKKEGTMTMTITTIQTQEIQDSRQGPVRQSNPESSVHARMPPPRSGCLTCPACFKEFARRNLLAKHVERHNLKLDGSLVCDFPFCDNGGKVFTSKWNLNQHIRTHTGETPFKCSHCGVGFKTTHGRKYHERSQHTGEMPFKCQYAPCERAFPCRQHLEVHELRAHTKEKNHVCFLPGCGRAFIMKKHLVEHERSHTGEKPIICTYCGRGFPSYKERTKHHRRHEKMIERMEAGGNQLINATNQNQ